VVIVAVGVMIVVIGVVIVIVSVVTALASLEVVPCAKEKGFKSNRARMKIETTEADSISFVRFSTKARFSLLLCHM